MTPNEVAKRIAVIAQGCEDHATGGCICDKWFETAEELFALAKEVDDTSN